jgi:long-chain acyl-CoA synthetase
LESTFRACNFVANICVHATPDAKQPIAIIIPHEVHLRQSLQSKPGFDKERGLEALCHDDVVKSLVLAECNVVGKKNGFKTMELLHAVILTPDEWTPESGLVTAAQKIQRNKIAKAFNKEIKVGYFFSSLNSAEGRITCTGGVRKPVAGILCPWELT